MSFRKGYIPRREGKRREAYVVEMRTVKRRKKSRSNVMMDENVGKAAYARVPIVRNDLHVAALVQCGADPSPFRP